MIVRAWWRPQVWLAKRRALALSMLLALALVLALVAGLLRAVPAVAFAGVAASLAIGGCAGGLAKASAGIAALVLTMAVAVLAGGDARTVARIAGVVALVVGPVLAGLRGHRAALAQHAAGRACGFAWLALLFAGMGAAIDGSWPAVVACLALGVAISLPLVASALTLPADPCPPEELPPITPLRWGERLVVPAVLPLATLMAIPIEPTARLDTVPVDLRQVAPLLAVIALVWGAATLRPLAALAALAGLLAGVGWIHAWGLDGRLDPLALGAAQAIPLLLWLRREEPADGDGASILAGAGILVLAGLLLPAWYAALSCAGGVTLALMLLPPARPVAGGDPLVRARQAFAGLDPSWRFYGLAKLKLDPVYARLAMDSRPWGRVLDLGCGPGLAAALAASRPDVLSYLGLDLDRDKLLVARRVLARCGHPLHPRWRLLHARAPLAPAPSGAFDTVLMLDVLHYAPVEVQCAILLQARALLTDDGVLFCRDGLADRSGSAGRVGLGERFTTAFGLNPAGRLHFLDEEAMRALLDGCGLRVVACEASGGENRLWICRPLSPGRNRG